jgi:hypothetical protein
MPQLAYGSILALQQAIPFGGFVRNIHHWSANLLVVAVFLHLLRVFFTGAYTGRRGLNWVVGMGLLGTVLSANFTGYPLPEAPSGGHSPAGELAGEAAQPQDGQIDRHHPRRPYQASAGL